MKDNMSAITGIFYRNNCCIPNEQIKNMNSCLSHRGPNGSGVWFEGSVALGHQMLHDTPESLNEILPFEDGDSGLVITSDARIDNRSELSKKLGIEISDKIPDSIFILEAYKRWGNKCPERLLGDFAFVIWDKNKKELFCARDHMGIKPFYYYLSDNLFIFATEIKALLTVNEIKTEVNNLKMVLDLKNIQNNNGFTYFENIFRLRSSHFLIVNSNEFQKVKYWDLDPNLSIKMGSEEEYFDRFKEIFSEAIKCRLRSVLPIGFELSGGIDSSSIVSMAQKICSNDLNNTVLNTFSIVFDDFPEADERYYIKKITERDGIQSHLINCDGVKLMDNIETILWYQDQPFPTPYLPTVWKSYEKMCKKNIRVLLTGLGGDAVVSHGRCYLLELAVTFRWIKLFSELKNKSKRLDISFVKLFINEIFFPLVPVYIKNIWHFLNTNENTFLNEDFFNAMNINEYDFDREVKSIRRRNGARDYHYFSVNDEINLDIFEIININTSAFSIEPRHPFYDKRLVEFCYAIPNEMKYRLGWDRYILRASMGNILPEEIQWRPRKAFLKKLLESNLFPYEKHLKKLIRPQSGILSSCIDWVKLKEFAKYHDHHKCGFSEIYKIWFIIILVTWYEYIYKDKITKYQQD